MGVLRMDSDPGFGRIKEYKGVIAIEQLMARQIDRVMEYESKRENNNYIAGVEGLIDLSPIEIENKAIEFKKEHGVYYDDGEEGKARYRALFRFIKHLLTESNIVWKRSSYEKGSERITPTELKTIETQPTPTPPVTPIPPVPPVSSPQPSSQPLSDEELQRELDKKLKNQ